MGGCRILVAAVGGALLALGTPSASASTIVYRVAAGQTATVTVNASRRGARALGSRRSQTVAVQLKPSTGDVVTRALKLRR